MPFLGAAFYFLAILFDLIYLDLTDGICPYSFKVSPYTNMLGRGLLHFFFTYFLYRFLKWCCGPVPFASVSRRVLLCCSQLEQILLRTHFVNGLLNYLHLVCTGPRGNCDYFREFCDKPLSKSMPVSQNFIWSLKTMNSFCFLFLKK